MQLIPRSRGAPCRSQAENSQLVRVFHGTFETPYLPAAVLAREEPQMEQLQGFPAAGQDPGAVVPWDIGH